MQSGNKTLISPPTAVKDGTITKLVKRILLTNAEVTNSQRISEHFCLVTLQGDELKKATWTPGGKIQVNMGAGFNNRTYTPIYWDSQTGQTQILAYLHGDTPGCEWAKNAQPRQAVRFLGPRPSLDLPTYAASAVLFGDETSIGLAAALRRVPGGDAAPCVLEVTDPTEAGAALITLGVTDAILIKRREDWSHLTDVHAALLEAASDNSVFFLTGRAASIQSIKKALTQAGIGNTRQRAKAYWASGKVGLD
jgi:ferric-chelate reductase (NADPH)